MRRLLVGLAVLLGLLLVADRVGASLAGRAVAAQVQSAAGLTRQPQVAVEGFPFLTQAVAGRYDAVSVVALDVPAGELTLARLDATLTGVRVPLSQALSGSVTGVPVSGVTARALVGYDELARRSGDRGLTVVPAGDRLRVTGSIVVLGRTVTATALSRVEVVDGGLLVTAESIEVGDAGSLSGLGDRLDLRIPVAGLPYGLQVTGVEVQPDGLSVRARTGATVLQPA